MNKKRVGVVVGFILMLLVVLFVSGNVNKKQFSDDFKDVQIQVTSERDSFNEVVYVLS